MENNWHIPIQQLQRRLRAVMVRLPLLAGNEAIKFILDNFRHQGFMGDSLQPWRKRKNPNRWGQSPKRNGRALLVDTGRLRRSWRIVTIRQDMVSVGSDDPKAKVHNEGLRIGQIQQVKAHERKRFSKSKIGTGTYSIKSQKENQKTVKSVSGTISVKAHTRRINQNIPKRQMIGKSTHLDNRIKRIITAEIMKAVKQ